MYHTPTIQNRSFQRKLALRLEKNSIIIFFGLFIFTVILLSFFTISTQVIAEKSPTREKLVTSMRIEKGDSLWSIAERYMTEEYSDIHTYINEIKRSNGLTSDVIHEGAYIIIPYYATAMEVAQKP
jgi:cell division protein YceG involved in septum cleavage